LAGRFPNAAGIFYAEKWTYFTATLLDIALDGSHQFFYDFVGVVFLYSGGDTAFQVLFQNHERNLIQTAPNGGDLVYYINTV
jgi:hypothetical protein